jgi:hypothetical protein
VEWFLARGNDLGGGGEIWSLFKSSNIQFNWLYFLCGNAMVLFPNKKHIHDKQSSRSRSQNVRPLRDGRENAAINVPVTPHIYRDTS